MHRCAQGTLLYLVYNKRVKRQRERQHGKGENCTVNGETSGTERNDFMTYGEWRGPGNRPVGMFCFVARDWDRGKKMSLVWRTGRKSPSVVYVSALGLCLAETEELVGTAKG